MNTASEPDKEFDELEKKIRWRDIPIINHITVGVFVLTLLMTFLGLSFMDYTTMKFKIFSVFYFITIAALIISLIILHRTKDAV
ncbi:hypothetical protein MUP79_03200 [Candidatus Bathyarchaeota archaeon]|nr:hypothetical protein [Candidatus Bathyarchaeota archaeon]